MIIGQIHITVDDLDRSVRFYRDTLGLTFLFDVPDQEMAFFQVGDTRLYLGKAESPEFASHPLLYFAVEDIEQEHARLVDAGVESIARPHVINKDGAMELWMAFLRDPGGHPFALMQERSVA